MIHFIQILFLTCVSWGVVFKPGTVPNPRPSGNWCVDKAGVFNSAEKAQIEAALESIHQSTRAEVALVTLPDIGQVSPKAFATELFNLWGIGRKGTDDGLLILLVTGQRRIEMETGYGLEGTLPDVVLFRIQQEHIVPALKAGHAAPGFLAAIDEIHKRILKTPAQSAGGHSLFSSLPIPEGLGTIEIVALVFSALLILIFLIATFSAAFRKDPLASYRIFSSILSFGFFVVTGIVIFAGSLLVLIQKMAGPLVFGVLIAVYCGLIALKKLVLWHYRRKPRNCGDCGKVMQIKDDSAEDEYQKPEEQLEERLGSLDYDVWVCENKHVRKDAYNGKNAYQYTDCGKCHRHTRKMISDVVTIPATTVHSGSGTKSFQCLNCGIKDKEVYVIAQISTSTSSSGGGSSSSSSSSGSFGGGSSGGGGAGSSY